MINVFNFRSLFANSLQNIELWWTFYHMLCVWHDAWTTVRHTLKNRIPTRWGQTDWVNIWADSYKCSPMSHLSAELCPRSESVGRQSLTQMQWLRKTLKQLLITFFSAFPYFCPHPKTGANFNNPKAPAVAAMRLSSRPVSAAAMALSPLGCAAWTFPGAIGSFQRADNLATKSCCNHIHTSPPSPLPPYVEMLPRSPPQWVKCLMIQLRWKHFAFLKSKPTFPNHNGI